MVFWEAIMRKTHRLGLILCCAVLLLGLCSCSTVLSEPEEKQFSKEGATITLTDEFTEKDLVSQTAYYESMDSIVVMLKEEFTLFEEAGYEDMTLSEYADLVIQANSLSAERKEEEGLTCFTYEKEQNGKNFEYYATVFKGPDAYWLIQFACETKNFDDFLPDFQKWANSVTFE